MTLESAIRDRLLALTPLTTLVGTRVFLLAMPQSEKRGSVIVRPVDAVEPQQLRGPAGLNTSRIQTDAYVTFGVSADPAADVAAIAAAVHGNGLGPNATGLFGWIGDLGGSPAQFLVRNVRLALRRGPMDEYEDERRYARVQQDYYVDWTAVT